MVLKTSIKVTTLYDVVNSYFEFACCVGIAGFSLLFNYWSQQVLLKFDNFNSNSNLLVLHQNISENQQINFLMLISLFLLPKILDLFKISNIFERNKNYKLLVLYGYIIKLLLFGHKIYTNDIFYNLMINSHENTNIYYSIILIPYYLLFVPFIMSVICSLPFIFLILGWHAIVIGFNFIIEWMKTYKIRYVNHKEIMEDNL